MKHSTGVMAMAVSAGLLGLFAAAGGCASAGSGGAVAEAGGEGGVVEVRAVADSMPVRQVAVGDPAGKPFIGAWKVDTKAVRALYPGDDERASYAVMDAMGYSVEVLADGTAMINGQRARWQTDGGMLWGSMRDGWPDGWRLRLASLDGDEEGLVRLQVGRRSYGSIFGGGAGGGARGGGEGAAEEEGEKKAAHPSDPPPDARYVYEYVTYPLVADQAAPDLVVGDVAGTWQLNFEETERAAEEGWERLIAAGVRRGDLPRNDQRSFERELKGSMGAPPVYVFRVHEASAPPTPAPFDAKEGSVGMAELQENGQIVERYTFDLWREYVVLYRIDGWHGIKPNRSYLRIVDGKLEGDSRYGVVLTRVP